MKSYERPTQWGAVSEPFSQENQMLTPKMSLRRNNILKSYAVVVDAMYGVKSAPGTAAAPATGTGATAATTSASASASANTSAPSSASPTTTDSSFIHGEVEILQGGGNKTVGYVVSALPWDKAAALAEEKGAERVRESVSH